MGIFSFWQTLAPARLRLLATSPRMATTLSRLMSFCTAVTASLASERSSSLISLIFLPRIPPWELISSIASTDPSCELRPKDAVVPVFEAYSPSTMSLELELPPLRLQELRQKQRKVMVMRSRQRIECSGLN